jgi:hypothetical protein
MSEPAETATFESLWVIDRVKSRAKRTASSSSDKRTIV